jgi:phage shock protein A
VTVDELKDVVVERKAELAKEKRKLQILYDSVKYHEHKMKLNVKQLDQVVAELKAGECTEEEQWQIELKESLNDFDEEEYILGNV